VWRRERVGRVSTVVEAGAEKEQAWRRNGHAAWTWQRSGKRSMRHWSGPDGGRVDDQRSV
jgi:hypothetical protein